MSDPEFQRLAAAVRRAEQAYGAAIDELARYLETRQTTIAKTAVADPATLGRVRDAVHSIVQTLPGAEWTTHGLAQSLCARELVEITPKTLENVYLPALRENCPHAVQSGKTWLWYKDAAKSREVPRDTVAPHGWPDNWPGKLRFGG